MILDDAALAEARSMLTACCGSSRWVEGMIARRPFGDRATALRAAEEIWGEMGESDWLEAFAHHPRIGGQRAAVAQDQRGAGWSRSEQASVSSAGDATRRELEEVNDEYERRFGFIYIVCATGKSAEEMLQFARARLGNDRATEIRIAADEQRKIMLLRLNKLFDQAKA